MPASPLPPAQPEQGQPLANAPARGSVKGLLAVLVLLMLALLLWQLHQEYRQLQDGARERNYTLTRELASHLELVMQMKADAVLALLRQQPPHPEGENRQLAELDLLRPILPSITSLAWLNPNGGVLADTQANSEDALFLVSLAQRSEGHTYHYAFSPQGRGEVYLILRQSPLPEPSGYWVLRLDAEAIRTWLLEHEDRDYRWLLEDHFLQRVLAQSGKLDRSSPIVMPVTAEQEAQTILVSPLGHSDWQLRALHDERQVRTNLLPELLSKFLLFLISASLALIALYYLQREQRGLLELNDASRRSLRQAASALGVIEERVLVTQVDGRLSYLNPQAEAMFGISGEAAQEHHLLALLPGLDPLLLNAPGLDHELGSDLVQFQRGNEQRLLAVTRNDLNDGAQLLGYVWVLRDVTEEQRALRVLQETRRRYQDIFEGGGIALCVLDLADLRKHLIQLGLLDRASLAAWVRDNPQQHGELLRRLRITEVNQVAMHLLGVSSSEHAWRQLIGTHPLHEGGIRFQLMAALLGGKKHLEMESQIITAQGQMRHIWLVLHLPDMIQDLEAVTLSINDITSRKEVELADRARALLVRRGAGAARYPLRARHRQQAGDAHQ